MAKKKSVLLEDVYRSREAKNFQKNPNFGEEPPNAKMDEMLVAKALDELQASGGDCPVVTMYDKEERIGVLVHISAEHLHDKYHATLFDKLFVTFSVSQESKICIAMDLEGPGKEKLERKQWLHEIKADLEERGYKNIRTCTEGEGKDVTLNCAAGTLVISNHDELLNENLNAL